jgi:hypothetical protein
LPARDLGVPVLAVTDRTYEYISMRYVGDSSSGKTQVWRVESHHGDLLGIVRWFGRWRQYTFWPSSDTIYSPGCLRDVAAFLDALMTERKGATS